MPVPKGHCCGHCKGRQQGELSSEGKHGCSELVCWVMPGLKTPGQVSSNGSVQAPGASLQRVRLWISHQEPGSPKQNVGTRSGRFNPYRSWECASKLGS